jgi:hypothetical protein
MPTRRLIPSQPPIARRPQADFEQVDKRLTPLAESTRCADTPV